MKRKFLATLAVASLFVGMQPEPAFANPQGGVVIGGDATATIAGEGTANVIINQFAENAVINWQDFSVQLNELTRFVQPGANAAALNRVLGGNPSQLLGSLQANGQIFLVNPNGILVGSQGSIDAQSFIASTLDISNESFLGRANMTFEGDSRAAIENYGSINALGGDIFLFAHQVKNAGSISALGGTVGLAAGNKIELRQIGNERIGVIIDNPTGEQTEVGVDNQGVVEAASAEIKAAGGNVYAVAINNGGEVRAEPKLVFEGGRLVIKSDGGTVVNSGTLSAANDSGKGGSVDVVADSVTLGGSSHIDASGTQGGGDILVWGDSETFARGTLAARGGAGAGGFVEVSSPISLNYGALTDTRADDGTAGMLLLDPGAFTISGAAAGPNNVNTLDLVTSLGISNVSLDTAAFPGGGAENITVTSPLAGSWANDLSLTAGNDILINALISNGGAGSLNLTAVNDIVVDGTAPETGQIVLTGGDLSFDAGNDVTTSGAVSTSSGGGVGIVAGRHVAINNAVVLGGGAFTAGVPGGALIGGNFSSGATGVISGGGDVSVGATGSVTLGASITGVDAVDIQGNTGIALNAAVSTTDNDIHFRNDVTIGAAFTIFSGNGGGAVTFDGAVNDSAPGANALAVDAGTGDVTFGGAIGGTTPFVSSRLEGGTVTLGGDVMTITGSQDYLGDVLLGADVMANAGAGNVTFTGKIDGNAANRTLTVNSAGTTAFAGNVGADQPLGGLVTDGVGTTTVGQNGMPTTIAVDGASTMTFNDPVTIAGDLTFSGMDGTFAAGIMGMGGDDDLRLNFSADTLLPAAVGAGFMTIRNFATGGGGTTIIDNDITTAGTQTYDDAVEVDVNLTLTGTTVTLNGHADAATGEMNSLDISGDLVLNSQLGRGVTGQLGNITTFGVTGSSTLNPPSEAGPQTIGTQTYMGPVTLGAATVILADAGADVDFQSTVNGNQGLTINSSGTTTFGGLVGNLAPLSSLTTDVMGDTVINAASINLQGSDLTAFNDGVTLGATLTVTQTGAGDVSFGSTVDGDTMGPWSLSVVNPNVTTFGADVGGVDPLNQITTDAGGSTVLGGGAPIAINTTGDQTYNDSVVLNVNGTAFVSTGLSGAAITFGGTVNSQATQMNNLTVVTSGATTFAADVGRATDGQLGTLTTDALGTTTVMADVQTQTTQTYNDAVIISGTVNLIGATGIFAVSLNGDGDMDDNLTLSFSGVMPGEETLLDVAGLGLGMLHSLTTGAGGETHINGMLTTTGSQTYNDEVVIIGDSVLAGTDVAFNNILNADDTAMDRTLLINGSGTTTFGGIVGGNQQLESLATDANGTTSIGADITTAGASITFADDVTLTASVTITELGTGDVTFAKTLGANTAGMETLSVDTSAMGGDVVFGGVVGAGGTTTLGSLTTTTGGGFTVVRANVTANTQQYNDGVILEAGGGGTITFTGSGTGTFSGGIDGGIDGDDSVTLNFMGITTLPGAGLMNIVDLQSGSGEGGITVIDGAINTSGIQTYNDAVRVDEDAVLTAGGAGVSFNSAVEGNVAGAKALNIMGNAVTADAIGGNTPLGEFTVSGTASIGGDINTSNAGGGSGDQTYGMGVTLASSAHLTSIGGTIDFQSAVDAAAAGTQTLRTTAATGGALFADAIGDSMALGALTVDDAVSFGSFNIITSTDGGASGDQIYQGTVTATGNPDFNANNGGNITFNSTLEGPGQVGVSAPAGTQTYNDVVGGVTPLTNLQTSIGGDTTWNGGTIDATGIINFNNTLTLTSDLTATSTGNDDILFRNTVDGPHNLTTTTDGTTTFGGAVGGMMNLTSVMTTGMGAVNINGGIVTTTGAQSYTGQVNLGDNTILTGTIGTFTGGIAGGGFDLELRFSGDTAIPGAAGLTGVKDLTAGNGEGGLTIIDDSITTTGSQTYNDDVRVDADATLAGTDITFNETLGADANDMHALNVNASGTSAFNGVVGGGSTALNVLTTDAAGSTTVGANISVGAGPSSFGDDVTLTADVTFLTDMDGDITFAGKVDSDATPRVLSFSMGAGNATVTFQDQVGNGNALASFSGGMDGTFHIDGDLVEADGGLDFNLASVEIGADTTIRSNNDNNISFVSSVTGQAGTETLTIEGHLFGPTGANNISGIASLDVTLTSTLRSTAASSVMTSGAQTYQGAVTLNENTTLNGVGIDFQSTVDSEASESNNLTIIDSGATIFAGAVGGAMNGELGSLITNPTGTTAINGGSVETTDEQKYGDNVSIGATPTLTAGTSVEFLGTVTETAPFLLTVNANSRVDFNADATVSGATINADVDGDGAGDLNVFDGATLNTSDTPLMINAGDLDLNTSGALNSGMAATTINNTSGHIALGDGSEALTISGSELQRITATDLNVNSLNAILVDNVTAMNSQNIAGTTTLRANDIVFQNMPSTFNALDAGSLNGGVTVNVDVTADFGSLTLDGDADNAMTSLDQVLFGPGGITVTGQTGVTLEATSDQIAGPGTGMGMVTVTAVTGDVNINSPFLNLDTLDVNAPAGTIHLNNSGTITGTGAQSYDGPVMLNVNATITGVGVSFNDTVNGNVTLSVVDSGTTAFNGIVGGMGGGLSSLTTDMPGGTTINTTAITAQGGTITFNDPVTLTSDVVVTDSGTTGVFFNNTVDSDATPRNLTVITTGGGKTLFGNTVGMGMPLASVTTDSTGMKNGVTEINGGVVTTMGDQTYNDPVTIGASTTFTGGTINFVDAIDAASDSFSLTIMGNAIFDGFGGGAGPFDFVNVTGNTTFNAGNTGQETLETKNGQTYQGAVTLGDDTTLLSNNGGSIDFQMAVDSESMEENDLIVNTGGDTIFQAAVGGGANGALGALTTDAGGTTHIDGGAVTSTGLQDYNDTVEIGVAGATVLTASTVDFAQNVTQDGGLMAGDVVLNINDGGDGGNAIFRGNVGDSVALGSLIVDGTTSFAGGTVTTTDAQGEDGSQTYGGLVTLSVDTTLTALMTAAGPSTGTFMNGVDGAGNDLTLSFQGLTTLTGNISNVKNLTSDNGNNTIINAAGITTTGFQQYDDAVILQQDTDLEPGGASMVSFNSTVDGTVDGTESLTVSGNVVFGNDAADLVGDTMRLQFVLVEGNTAFNATGSMANPSVETLGAQDYGNDAGADAAIISADTYLTAGGAVTFNSTVDGDAASNDHDLTVDTANTSTTFFNGVVGGTTANAIESITTNADGETQIAANITTDGASMSFNDPVVITADVIITELGAGDITFAQTVNGDGTPRALTVNNPNNTFFTGPVGTLMSLGSVATDTGGTTHIDGGFVTTSGTQTYGDNVELGNAGLTTLIANAGNGNVTFEANVDASMLGVETLLLDANLVLGDAGADAIGGATAIGELTVNGTSTFNSTANPTVVTTTMGGGDGDQLYTGAVTLQQNTTLNSTGGTVTFDSTIDGAFSLTINASAQFGGAGTGGGDFVGSSAALSSVAVNGLTTFNAAGDSANDASVRTTGAQTYSMAATLNADIVLASDTMGQIQFGGNILSGTQNAHGLTVNTAGTTQFQGGMVGPNPNELQFLVTDDPAASAGQLGGTTEIIGTFNTFENQTFNDAVVLTGSVVNNSANNGGIGDVTYALTLNGDGGAWTLNVNTGGQTIFGGVVGAVPFTSITTDLDGAGGEATQINGGSVTTIEDQFYGDPVTLGADATITGNDITFNSTLDDGAGGPFSLDVNTMDTGMPGITLFNGAIGSNDPLRALTTNADGETHYNGLTADFAGSTVTHHDAVILLNSLTITEAGTGDVTFNSTVHSFATEFNSLTVNTTGEGATIFNAAVGAGANQELGALTTDATGADGTTQINGATVETTGIQTYNDPVTIGVGTSADATLTGATVIFNNTLDAATAAMEGVTIIGDAVFGDGGDDWVGNTASLDFLSVSLTTTFNSNSDASAAPGRRASVLTENNQTYNGNVTLGNHTILSSDASGTITFAGTINGDGVEAWDLFVNTAGLTQFAGGMVGDMNILRNLVTDDLVAPAQRRGGTTELSGVFNTTINQQFWDDVILKTDVINNSTMTGDVRYDLTLNGDGTGPFDLTVNTAGITIFNGVVGGMAFLDDLTTDMPGSTQINGGAITTDSAADGDQLFNDTVTLGADTSLLGNDVTFAQTLDSDGTPRSLLVTTANTGLTTFNGQVGGMSELSSLTTDSTGMPDGTTIINGGVVATTGGQTYNDPLLIGDPDANAAADNTVNAANLLNRAAALTDAGFLDSRTTLSSSAAGQIHFAHTVDDDATAGESHLLVNTAGITRFDRLVGATAPLTTLETDVNGVDLAGEATHINSPDLTSGTFALSNVTTDGYQTYNDNVNLNQDLAVGNGLDVYVKVTTANAEITFVNRIDGRDDGVVVTDDFEQGLTIFTDRSSVDQTKVGIIVPLEFLDISDGPSGMNMQTLTLSMDTEIKAGLVILGFVDTGGNDLVITANDIDFTAGAGSVMSGSPTDILTLRPIESTAVINGPGMHPDMHIGVTVDVVGAFSLSDDDLAAIADGFNSITIGRFDGANNIFVETSDFSDPVRIQSPVGGTISITGSIVSTATTAEAMAAGTSFAGDLDENNNPILVDGFGLGVPGMVPPSGNGAGVLIFGSQSTTELVGVTIETDDTPIQFTDTVNVLLSSTLDTTGGDGIGGSDIIFNNPVNSDAANANTLTLIAGDGDVDFRSTVGATFPLLQLTIQDANDVDFDSTVAVAGLTQSNGDGTTVIRGNVTISATAATTGINLTTGTIVLGDDGDSSMADGTPQFSGDGAANGVTLTSNGDLVRFNGAVTLVGGDATVNAGAGAITAESTIAGAQNLDLNATGVTSLRGAVTGLLTLETDAGGGTEVNGGGVTTTGIQTYGDNVTVDVMAATFDGAVISFNGTLDGAEAVTINDTGTTTFAMTVGFTTPLSSLLTDAGGTTAVNGDSVRTSGTQTYNDNVTLDGDTGFTGTTVTFNEDATGAGNTLTITGDAVFGDAAEDVVTSSTLLVTGTTLANAATVTTAGATQTYNGDVTLGNGVNFTGSTVNFDEDVTGANTLTVTGDAVFGNAADDAVNTSTILVTGATTVNGATVTSTGATQTYNGNVTLNTGVNFTGTTVSFDEDIIGAANTLTITGDAVLGDASDDAVASGTLLVTGASTVNSGTVTTAGATQTYNGNVTLGSSVNFTGTTVSFDEDIIGGANTLTVTGDAVLGDAADDAFASGTLLVTGATLVNGATVATAGATQTYNGNVTLATGVNFTGTTVSFDEDVIGNGNTFTVTGDAVFGTAADDAVSSGTLLVTGATTVNGATVTTFGATQTYNGNVTLTTGVNFTGTTVSFDEDIIGAANTLTITGDAVLGDASDDAVASGTLLVTGASTVNAGTVTTAAATQTYNGNVTLGSSVNFTGTTVSFDEDIIGGANTLTVTGDAVFGDAADDAVASSTLLVTGASTVNAGTVTTAGATQTYNGNVTLGSDVNFTGTTVSFDEDVIGGANSFTVTGDAVFGSASDDAIASGTLLVTGATTVNAGTVTTAGATQTYNGNVTLGSGVNFTGTTVSFDEDIIGAANSLTVTGDAVFGDAADDAVASGTLLVTGATTVNAATVTTAGATQTYNGNVTLTTGVNFTGTTASFDEDILGGGNSLTVTGNAVFGDAADDAVVSGTLLVTGTTLINSSTVTTAGATQTYTDQVTLGNDATLTGSTITFLDDVDATTAGMESLTIMGDMILGDGAGDYIGGVGGMALEFLLVTGTTTINSTPVAPPTIVTTGAQTYMDAFSMGAGADTTLSSTGGAAISFGSTVDGAQALTVNTAGATTFSGIVGGVALTTLTTDAGGTTTFNMGATSVSANVLDFNDAVLLDTTTDIVTMNSGTAGAGGLVDFASTVDSVTDELNSLIINSDSIAFHGNVGEAAGGVFGGDLNELEVNELTGAAGVTTIDAAIVNGATLDFNMATLIDDGGAGAPGATVLTGLISVDFASTLDSTAGEANILSVVSPITGFQGAVGTSGGGTGQLGSLTTDAAGTTAINGGAVRTSGIQLYNDDVTFDEDLILTSTGAAAAGNITLVKTVSDLGTASDLTVNTGGTTTFGGAVTADSVATDATGTTAINGGVVTTALGQDYGDNVTLGADAVLTSVTATGEDIDFRGTINGAANLTVTETGNGSINFHMAVGNMTALTSLTVNAGPTAGSSIVISGGEVTTTMAQTYNVPSIPADALNITLLDLTLNGTDITFNSRINGNGFDLTVNGSGVTSFLQPAFSLGALITDAAGDTLIDSPSISGVDLTFNDPVVIAGETAETVLTGSGTVTFNGTLNSAANENNDLSIVSPATTFGDEAADTVGVASAFDMLTTDMSGGANTTTINTTIVSADNIDFNDMVLVGAQGTIFNGSTDVRFDATLDSVGASSAVVVNSPMTTFTGPVGTTTLPLLSLVTDGTAAPNATAINGGTVTTTTTQTYGDDVTLGMNTTLTSTGAGALGDITFNGTVDGAVADMQSLTVDTAGTTAFNGLVGVTAALSALTTDTPGFATFNTPAIIANAVDINDPLTLAQNVTVTAMGSATFDNTVDGDGTNPPAEDLIVVSPMTSFNGAVGGIDPLGTLMTDNHAAEVMTVIDTGVVNAAIVQFDDPVDIANDAGTIITGTVSVTFNNTLDSAAGENNDLSVISPSTTFGDSAGNDDIGSNDALGSLTTDNQSADDTTTINSANVTTTAASGNTGHQTYGDAVTIGNRGGLTDTTTLTGVNVLFNSTVDASAAGGQNLVVDASGLSVFGDGTGHDAVGGEFALGSLRTDSGAAIGSTVINSSSVTTATDAANSGDQFYNDAVVVGSNDTGGALTTLNGVNVTFDSTLDAAMAGVESLTVNSSGMTTFGSTAADGSADNVGGGNVAFVGSGALNTLITDDAAGGDFTVINSGSVSTTVAQTYNDPVFLGTSGAPSATTILNSVAVNFNNTLDALVADTQSLVINATGAGTFGDAVGNDNVGAGDSAALVAGSGALAFLTTDRDIAASGTTVINSTSVNTTLATGDQIYNDAVVVGTSGAGANVTTLNGNDITFNSTVDGDGVTASIEDLTVNSNGTGTTTFGDAAGDDLVGGTTPLGNLITNADGNTDINSTSVTTTADQTYNDGVIIGTSGGAAPANLLTTLNGVNITFNKTVDAATAGDESLLVNGSGVTTFGDAALDDNVGGGNGAFAGSGPLVNLTTDDSAATADTTVVNSAFVTTTLDQTYNDAVTLGTSGTGNVVTTFTGNDLTFNGTVDGAAAGTQDLVANSTGGGTTTFGDGAGSDDVGAATALQNLTTNADGLTDLNATSLTTTQDQTYNDAVIVGTSGTGAALTTINANDTTFNSTLDATTAGVESLTVNSSRTAGANAVLEGFGPDGLEGTADDPATDDDIGFTTFGSAIADGSDDNVGGIAALASLLTNADGAVVINSASVTTTVSQTHNDAAFLGTSGTGNATTTLSGVAVSFNSTTDAAVAGAQSLIVNATGATTFGDGAGSDNVGVGDSAGLVAGSGSLAYLVTDANTGPVGPGTTVINSSTVTTTFGTGDQTYNDGVILGSNTSAGGATTTLNGSDISFNSTVDATTAGVENLVVNSSDMVGELDVAAGVDGILGTLDDVMVAGDGIGVTTFGLALVLGADGLAGTVDDVLDGSNDNVGGVTALGTITTDADGLTVFNAALINSFGDQTYNDNTVIAFSGAGVNTTTLNAVGTGAANVTVGTAPPAGTLVNGQTMMGLPLGDASGIPNNKLVANADACVMVHSAMSGIFSVNGTSGVCWFGANPMNTGIRMYYSQPVSPIVFLFNSPPAQFRIDQFLIDVGGIFAQDLQNLIRYPQVSHPEVEIHYNALREAQRQGLLPTDLILSTYDLFAEDEEEE